MTRTMTTTTRAVHPVDDDATLFFSFKDNLFCVVYMERCIYLIEVIVSLYSNV